MPDAEAFLPAALAAADAAGVLLRRWFRAGLEAVAKLDESPVTIADRQAEEAMRSVLAGLHPDHGILGEEGGLQGGGQQYRWVLDPIDGTRAFITGRPVFGTLIALLEDDVPVLGVIDQPVTGERWIGCAGAATQFEGRLGGRIGARHDRALAACELSCTSPEMFSAGEDARFRRLAGQVRRVSYGGDCYAYGLLALGQIDIVAEADLKIWDWAALLPVLQGAGGCMTDWAGAPLSPTGDGRVLALANPALLGEAVAALAE